MFRPCTFGLFGLPASTRRTSEPEQDLFAATCSPIHFAPAVDLRAPLLASPSTNRPQSANPAVYLESAQSHQDRESKPTQHPNPHYGLPTRSYVSPSPQTKPESQALSYGLNQTPSLYSPLQTQPGARVPLSTQPALAFRIAHAAHQNNQLEPLYWPARSTQPLIAFASNPLPTPSARAANIQLKATSSRALIGPEPVDPQPHRYENDGHPASISITLQNLFETQN